MPRNEIEEIYGRVVASYFIGPQFKYVRQHFFVELNAENTQLLMFRCTAIDVYLKSMVRLTFLFGFSCFRCR